MATDLEKKFKMAAWLITNGPPRPGTPTDVKLQYYSLFKQATVGDVTGEQPWAVQFEVGASMIRELCAGGRATSAEKWGVQSTVPLHD